MSGARLRLECDGPTRQTCRVWLDDLEISKYCHGLSVEVGVEEANKATPELFVDHIDLGLNADVKVLAPVLRRSA